MFVHKKLRIDITHSQGIVAVPIYSSSKTIDNWVASDYFRLICSIITIIPSFVTYLSFNFNCTYQVFGAEGEAIFWVPWGGGEQILTPFCNDSYSTKKLYISFKWNLENGKVHGSTVDFENWIIKKKLISMRDV